MRLTYLGHSCFKLEESTGTTVVCDPYSSQIGYSMPKVKAGVVTVSHRHFDHDNVQAVEGNPKIFYGEVTSEVDGVVITAIKSFHDSNGGAERGENTIFKIRMDGITVCHMGDIGEQCSSELIESILPVDVLLIPVGGNYTIDAAEAKEYVDRIMPNIVVPMHYKTKGCHIDIDKVDAFVDMFDEDNVEYADKNYIDISRDYNMTECTTVIVLEKE